MTPIFFFLIYDPPLDAKSYKGIVIVSLSTWCSANFLMLSPDKTKLLTSSRKREILFDPYALQSGTVTCLAMIRYLVIYFDTKFSFFG